MLGTRVTRAARRLLATGAALALAAGLTACGPLTAGSRDGQIDELERGRNGVSVEVRTGSEHEEFYLIPRTVCEVGDLLSECADADDVLVVPAGAVPGINGVGGRAGSGVTGS